VAKDRARPFSKKHRRYWLTVTGGMLLIGGINVAIGMCVYDKGPDRVERIDPVLPVPKAPEPGTIGLGEIPADVMRAFTKAHPQHVPQSARKIDSDAGQMIEVYWLENGVRQVARYRVDGTAVE
jgi:hypothetical protein